MRDSEPSRVFMFDNTDPEMQRATEKARASFRYFWRELAWERRRIVPALELACVKAPFSDGDSTTSDDGTSDVEHMWMSEINFDGHRVHGVLLNSPNWLKRVKAGDAVSLPLAQISDWMYVIGGEVYGAFTVNLLRARMSRPEQLEHDAAWGLNFGDPLKTRIIPEPPPERGLLKGLFGKKQPTSDEHPMSVSMADSLREHLARNPSMMTAPDARGWTLLHHEALAGSAPTVKVLLAAGADRHAKTKDGITPVQLARVLGWENVIALLRE